METLAVIRMNNILFLGSVGIRCVMALIQGVKCLFLCPQCLIPESEQGDVSPSAPLRTAVGTKAVIQRAREQRRVGDREEILKGSGLQDVDVCLHFHYPGFVLQLTTFLAEYILED